MTYVKRFVAPRPYLVTDDFSPSLEMHGASGILTFNLLRNRRASLVIGEPGAGKSTALRDLRDAIIETDGAESVRHFDLKDYSEVEIKGELDALVGRRRVEGSVPTLLLDSIDEARFQIRTLVPFLERRLNPLIDAGWHVVATCRTAETVPAIDALFESFDESAVHVLLPLMEADVIDIVQDFGLEAGPFLGAIEQQSLQSLAVIPFTLELLCRAYSAEGLLGSSRQEVYERAVALLLAQGEVAGDGYAPRMRLPAAPIRVRLAAERLALFATLLNGDGFSLYRPGEAASGIPTERIAGTEFDGGVAFELNQEDLQFILQTGLFADSGKGQRQFSHRSLRDFLAAQCLSRWKLQQPQLASFLTASNGLASIPPQMLDLATWLLIIDPDAWNWLVKADAFNLSRNRLAIYRPELGPQLVDWLLDHAAESNRVLEWHDTLPGLAHPELVNQLRPALGSEEHPRLMALSILKHSYVGGLEDELLQIAIDPRLTTRERMNAIEILKDKELDHQLSELSLGLDGLFEGDHNAQLRGSVLSALWPTYISTDRMLGLLVDPPEHLFGSYENFLHSAEMRLSDLDAASILNWAAERSPSVLDDETTSANDVPHGRAIRQLIEAACVISIQSPTIATNTLEDLSVIGLSKLGLYPAKLPMSRAAVPLSVWRDLIERIVRRSTDADSTFYGILSGRDALGASILQRVDLEWAARNAATSEDSAKLVWLKLTNWLIDESNPNDLDVVWQFRSGPVWDYVGYRYAGTLIASPEAEQQKEIWKLSHEPVRVPTDSSISEVDYRSAIAERIAQVAEGNEPFYHLVRWLDVDLARGRFIDSHTPDLLDLNGFPIIDAGQAAIVIDLALNFLESDLSAVFPDELEPNTGYSHLESAYRALHTLEKHSPDRLDRANVDWGLLALPVMNFHLQYGGDLKADSAIRRRLLFRIHDRDVDQLAIEVGRRLLDSTSFPDHSIADLRGVLSKPIVDQLEVALHLKYSPTTPEILNLLFSVDPQAAADWSTARIAKSDDVLEIAGHLLALLNHSPEIGFPALFAFTQISRELAQGVLLEIAQNERHAGLRLGEVSDLMLLQLFEWLADNFPGNEEDNKVGLHTRSSRDDLLDFRERLLRRVVQNGSKDALVALTALSERRQDLHLEWSLSALRESNRLNGWTPLALEELRTIRDRRDARLVRSDDDLLRAVLEALEEIQGWLVEETPQAFSLWNQTVGQLAPKDENTISDWYCHALRLRLIDKGLIVNREVEVKRRSQHGVGLRQDLRVEVIDLDSSEKFILVIEVKGIWNPGVRSNLVTQLAGDYLTANGLTHGIYLVVSFDPAQVEIDSKKKAIEKNLAGNLLGHLEHQALGQAPALQIRPVIHDGSLPK